MATAADTCRIIPNTSVYNPFCSWMITCNHADMVSVLIIVLSPPVCSRRFHPSLVIKQRLPFVLDCVHFSVLFPSSLLSIHGIIIHCDDAAHG